MLRKSVTSVTKRILMLGGSMYFIDRLNAIQENLEIIFKAASSDPNILKAVIAAEDHLSALQQIEVAREDVVA